MLIFFFAPRYSELNERLYSKCRAVTFHVKHYQLALGIPLGLLPIYQRMRDEIDSSNFQFEEQQIGVFNVVKTDFEPTETSSLREDNLVIFGGSHVYPSCTCAGWYQTHVPCIHMFAIFRFVPGWKYDSLSVLYRLNPLLDIDYSACAPEPLICHIAERADVACQITTKLAHASSRQSSSAALPSNIFVSDVPTSIPLLINLKNFKTQIQELDKVFSDKRYSKHLQNEIDTLIDKFEVKVKAATSRENSGLDGSLSSKGLRQTNDKFVSMNAVIKIPSTVPVIKRDALKDVEKLSEDYLRNTVKVKKTAKKTDKKSSSVKKNKSARELENQQIDFAKPEK